MSELDALGMYLLVCLGFVVFALLEFSLVMLRNRYFSGAQNGKRSALVEKRNRAGGMPQMKKKDGQSGDNKFKEANEKILKSVDKTDSIAFGVYLLLFVLFNCFYWNHFLSLHCK